MRYALKLARNALKCAYGLCFKENVGIPYLQAKPWSDLTNEIECRVT